MIACTSQTERLRCLIHDSISNQLYSAATFYADKLVTFSQYAPEDVYLLAQTYFVSKQYRRALALLRRHELLEKDLKFKLLAAKCVAEFKEWDECLAILGDGEAEDLELEYRADREPPHGTGISLYSSTCLLRGQAFEALDNRPRAITWFQAALKADPYCFEAFTALVDNHMLSNEEELDLIDALHFHESDRWLALLYRAKCKKYLQQDVINEILEELELPSPAPDQPLFHHNPLSSMPYSPQLSRQQQQQQQQQATSEQQQQQQQQQDQREGQATTVQQQQQQLLGTPAPAPRPAPQEAPGSVTPSTSVSPMSMTPSPMQGLLQGQAQVPKGSSSTSSQKNYSARSRLRHATRRPDGAATDDMDAEVASPDGTTAEEEPSTSGCGLAGNLDVLSCRADWYYFRGAYEECYKLTSAVLAEDSYALQVLPVYLAAALALGRKNELFLRGHQLAEEYPQQAVSWFAVGCYYMCIQQYDQARRFFGKATSLDKNFSPAWIGFGHAFSAQDERDQAMAAYRTAHRLFPGLHLPLLGMGMEYSQMNNLALSERMLLAAHEMCPLDPAVCHELGVLNFKNRQYAAATVWLRTALELQPNPSNALAYEPTIVNLAHCLRKQHSYGEALQLYNRALSIAPGQAGTYSALGYTYHLVGNLPLAIENYHAALALQPDHLFTIEMLNTALQEYARTE